MQMIMVYSGSPSVGFGHGPVKKTMALILDGKLLAPATSRCMTSSKKEKCTIDDRLNKCGTEIPFIDGYTA